MSVQTALAALSVFRDNLYKYQSSYTEEYFVAAEQLTNNCEFFLQRNLVTDLIEFLQKELKSDKWDSVSGFLDAWWEYTGIQGTASVRDVMMPCWEDFERNLKEE